MLYKLGLSAQVPFFDLYRLSFCCLAFACILLAFCLLAFSFVAILHCCAFSFPDFFLSVLLPALLSDLSFTVIFLAVLPCDDLDYPHDFPTVSVPSPVQLISPCADHGSGLPNRRSGRSSCSDHGIISPSNMRWKEIRASDQVTGEDAIPLPIS